MGISKEIEPKQKLIADYLALDSDELFVIPAYQRSYSWGKQQCDKLWQDIWTFMDAQSKDTAVKKSNYFLGTIIADCSPNKGEPDDGKDKIKLIDGQQRTITFVLLLKALLLRIIEVLGRMHDNADSRSLKAYDGNILVFLNEYLYAKLNGKKFDFSESVNIEHIMPVSGRNISTIRQDAGIESIEEFNAIVNSLGNKILLEENINKNISNDWFKTKKQRSVKEKLGYNNSEFDLARALTTYPKDIWGKDDIEKATGKAVARILAFISG